MLTQSELTTLERSLHGRRVLSVYIDGESPDPAQRTSWRTALENELDSVKREISSATHAEREDFALAVELLEKELSSLPGGVGAPGFVAFVTPQEMRYAAALPVRVPTRVVWGERLCVAPYVRAGKALRPAIVVVADRRKARVFRYHDAVLDEIETLRAHAHVGPVYHMGDATRQGFGSNVRGRTGTDQAERSLRAGFDRMVGQLAERLARLAGGESWIVIGGTREAARAVAKALPEQLAPRALVLPSLNIGSTDAEIAQSAERGATQLRRERDGAVVNDVMSLAGAGGRGAVRLEPTLRALRARAVQELLFTQRFVVEHPDEAERVVSAALEQGALVEEVSGEGGSRLDSEADGIGALLRFVTAPAPATNLTR
jgi:hypothetical protein